MIPFAQLETVTELTGCGENPPFDEPTCITCAASVSALRVKGSASSALLRTFGGASEGFTLCLSRGSENAGESLRATESSESAESGSSAVRFLSAGDAVGCRLGADEANAVGGYLCVSASLTKCKLLCNNFGANAATLLVEAVKDKDVSLAGIEPNQTAADFSRDGLKPGDAMLLASDLSKPGVSASLTNLS